MSAQTVYDLSKVQFSYLLGETKIEALKELTLKINAGEFVCLSGPSGSGKTTLLNLLGVIERPTSGQVRFDDVDLALLGEREKSKIRLNKVGFIFQNFNLIPTLSALENVEYFLVRQGVAPLERKKRAESTLARVGLADQIHKRPMQMSGGQRQRVAIARAMAKNPRVIVADEPTASLDQKTGRGIMETLLELNKRSGVTVITASHDPMVMELSRRNIRMKDGIVLEGVHS